VSSLISKIGNFLTPQASWSSTLPYDTYAAPQREVLNQFVKDTMRPQFEYTTLNPFKSGYRNTAATSNSWMMGNAPKLYKRSLSGVERTYQDQLDSTRNMYEEMIRQGYNKKIGDISNSPTALNNLGK
jgi:hypothetical protein